MTSKQLTPNQIASRREAKIELIVLGILCLAVTIFLVAVTINWSDHG